MTNTLPDIDEASFAHSQRVLQHIITQIQQHPRKKISFADYMQLALYAPGLGYYNAGSQKFGKAGDFITAPELSPLFAQTLAKQCEQVLGVLKHRTIIEFGAGSGKLAGELLTALSSSTFAPEQYWIVEVSPDLRQRQQQYLQQHYPQVVDKIQWLQQLPTEKIQGVIIANEVLDAMPVHRFTLANDQLEELWITNQGMDLQWCNEPLSHPELTNMIEHQLASLHIPQPYTSELCLQHAPWIHSVANLLDAGCMLLLDYGYPAREYYHPQRQQGTLTCFFRHHSHDNPLLYPGVQDITAHVNFTAIAEAGYAAGLEIAGYTNQGSFLLNCGIDSLLATIKDDYQQVNAIQQLKQLTAPDHMGELFKVMALSRKISYELLGFTQLDRLHQL